MLKLKFQHVFAGLMGLSALGAFVIPPRYTFKAQPQVQAVFAPVAEPVGRLAAWAHGRVAPEASDDHRAARDVKVENDALWVQIAHLQKQLDTERERYAEYEKMGSLRERCVPVARVGYDAGPRDSLLLRAGTLDKVRDGLFVLYPGGMVGRIEGKAGLAGAQVRLITDRGFKVRGSFAALKPRADGSFEFVDIAAPQVLVEGIGGKMIIRQGLTTDEMKDAGLKPGHWVVVDDSDWPTVLKGYRLGQVTSAGSRADAPLFAELHLEPSTNLAHLPEVMVLTKP